MIKTAPNPIDVQDLQFKLRCRLKVFDNVEVANFSQPCNLITCASRFGLIFVGTNSSDFQVIQLKQIESFTKSDGDKPDYPRRNVSVASPPKHLSVNCEHTILSVVIEKNNCPVSLFYDVKSFWQQEVKQLGEVRLSATPGVYVTEINWNPALSATFTACKSDGTLGIYEVKIPGIDINELPAGAAATCFCWSPKGKQIAVGSRDGKITQYKPDLKAVKVINAPPLKAPHSLISLQWVSNYQFIGVFQPVQSDGQPCLIVIDSPKTGDPAYLNYDDICYSNGNARPPQFYMILQHAWNILMVASSNSMEVGILGNSGESWTQWIMGDAARAELPLSSNHQETLPVGIGLDIGNMQPLQWGESTLPPTPILLLLSHHGTLCCFNVVNLKEGVPTVCTPPDPIQDTSGISHFIVKTETPKQEQLPVKQQEVPPPTQTIELPKTVQPQVNKISASGTNPSTPIFQIQSNAMNTKPQGQNFQATSLFGGQTTLIPVTQGNQTKVAPSQSLYPTLPYQMIYPSLPNSDTSTIQISTANVTSPLVTRTPVTTQPQLTVTSTPKPKVNQIKAAEEPKTDVVSIDQKAEQEAEILFSQMVREECVFLESELKAVLHQGRALKINLGSDDDKTRIVESTKSIQDFFKELVDICTTQNAEVHILKQNLLQSWAWFEEVKSRYMASTDDAKVVLLRAQPLDSASEKKLADIRHANYYLESQIAQAHRALDEQWEAFQDSCKKNRKLQMPTMEMIFQTMVKQNGILWKQRYILKDIASQIKNKSRSGVGSSLLLSLRDAADLPDELTRLRMNPEDICQIQYEQVVDRMKNLTKKTDNLRCFLKKREYPHISAVKPQLSSTILQASPSTKLKAIISSLDAKPSPIFKETTTTRPSFVQATEKPVAKLETTTSNIPIGGVSSTTGLNNFVFQPNSFNKLQEMFTSMTKTTIASSPNSAFVSTSFGNTFFTSTPSSSSFKPVAFGTTTTATSSSKPAENLQTTTAPSTVSKPITANTSKPFTFTSTSVPFVQEVPSTTAAKTVSAFVMGTTTVSTAGSATKPSFSFTLQGNSVPKTTTAPIVFGKVEAKSASAVAVTKPETTKPNSVLTPTLNLTVTKSTVTTADPVGTTMKTTSIFATSDNPISTATKTSIFASITGTPSTSVFSQNITVTTPSVFGTTIEKSSETPTTTPIKPFIFSSVSTPKTTAVTTVTTAQNRSVAGTDAPQPLNLITSTTGHSVKTSPPNVTAVITIPKYTTQPVTTSSQATLFGSPQATTKSPPALSFFSTSAPQSSIFSTPITAASTQSSIFAAAVSKPSIFSSAVISQPPSTTSTAALVVPTPITASAMSTTVTTIAATTPATTTVAAFTTSSVVSTPSMNSSFGTSVTSQPSIFGTPISTTSSFTPVNSTTGFGFSSTPSTTTSVFGSPSATKPSIFGSAPASTAAFAAASPAQPLAFGAKTPPPVFGSAVATTAQSPIFGTPASTTTQSQGFGLFGDGTQKSSIFGTPPPASQSSIFGSSNQNTVFGATTTTASPVFGQTQSIFEAAKTAPSVFGQSSTFGSSTFGSTGVFGGSTPSFGQSSGSIFGSAATTTSANIFGGTPTTSSAFGSSPSVFGTPVSSTPSVFGPSVFASTANQPSSFTTNTNTASFGFGSLNVGSAPTTSSSGFGASPAPNPFGGENKSVFGENKSLFGSSSGASANSVFGSGTNSNIFGGTASQGFGSGFGNQSVFGQQSTFGQSTFGSSTFGQQGPGPFSGGSSGTVAQSGFGAGPAFQKPGGFGGSPVFGATSAFGGPSFGGAPTFGSSPTFGSTSKIFGAGSTTFGATNNTQTAGFGNLANQSTVGFGNLAQQAANSPTSNAPFSGNSSFSSWR